MTPLARGSAVAIAAALLFGVTTPLVQRFGGGVGPFATATLLYAGAALASIAPRRPGEEPALGREHLPRIAVVGLFGAALAPASLAWGLQHTSALAASLLLNTEAIFTVTLAWALHREPIGRRLLVAVALMGGGGVLLAARSSGSGTSSALGLAAVVGATLAWAVDNTLTRPLADLDPRAVVLGKSLCGGALAGAIALASGERWPHGIDLVGLAACGAAGYGLSLRLYLRAQRRLGAGRTGSLFATAPFVGAAAAFVLGDRAGGPIFLVSALLFGAAVVLHVTERHGHRHAHAALEHEHAHVHRDGHHTHAHDPPFAGVHSHPHVHESMEHEHPHGVDLHHDHAHHTRDRSRA